MRELCFEKNTPGLILWGDPMAYNNICVNDQGSVDGRRKFLHNVAPFEYSDIMAIYKAAEKARSARFEFGRKGAK